MLKILSSPQRGIHFISLIAFRCFITKTVGIHRYKPLTCGSKYNWLVAAPAMWVRMASPYYHEPSIHLSLSFSTIKGLAFLTKSPPNSATSDLNTPIINRVICFQDHYISGQQHSLPAHAQEQYERTLSLALKSHDHQEQSRITVNKWMFTNNIF